MTDPNMTEFYGRVARLKKARAKGYGFEAPGSLGRSYYYRPVSRRGTVVAPILFLLICLFVLKALILSSIGAETYNNRVAALKAGQGIEPLGGWIMQADPVTFALAQVIGLGSDTL